MFEAIRDAAKIGLGALWLSKENLKKLTDDLVEIGKVSKEEGDRLFREFEKSGQEYKKNLTELVESSVKEALDQAGLAPKEEVEELRKRVEELEKRLKAEGENEPAATEEG